MHSDSTPAQLEQRLPALASLEDAIQGAAKLLPVPGPITAFAFLNTLEALEDLPFDEGLKRGSRLYGCQPYLPEIRFREFLYRGRIRLSDLELALRRELGERGEELVAGLTSLRELRLAMLEHPLQQGPEQELRWFVAETDALRKMRKEASTETRERFLEETRRWIMREYRSGGNGQGERLPRDHGIEELIAEFGAPSIERWSEATWEAFALRVLWRVCRGRSLELEPPSDGASPLLRHRDAMLRAGGEDSDVLTHELLTRFCAVFTDQGFARWSLPEADQGFYRAFVSLYGRLGKAPSRWMAELPGELAADSSASRTPLESVHHSLTRLGVPAEEWPDFIAATILALRGWAGMLWHMDSRRDRVPFPVPEGTLTEFLAIRLVVERVALAHVAHETLGYRGPLAELRQVALARKRTGEVHRHEQIAFQVFQLAQVLGWTPPQLAKLPTESWAELIAQIASFDGLARRAMFHEAFERRFRVQTLDAISVHGQRVAENVKAPRFQACFCLDAREESFRRHLEETAPDVETFGAAGFFGVAMYYRGAADAHFAALCPIVIKPRHWVVEDVAYSFAESHRRRATTRKALGTVVLQTHVQSRKVLGGALITAGLGVLASAPLVARVLMPRLTSRLRKTAGRLVEPPRVTRLRLERVAAEPGIEDDQIGYSLDEMADIGERMLRDIGLISGFARLVFFFGHGSFCLNNPHKSSYDCGACSGTPGGPNGRALAYILNDARVRAILAQRGLEIPHDTRFVGGLHNTTLDSLTFLDLDLLPRSHATDFEAACKTLDEACLRNAHERCRRFQSASLELSLAGAHRHVEERSEDLAQTRPEYGNASNAICFVGRRSRTRGLYLDRRSFLASYDPTQDDEKSSILQRILSAAVPVCEGINMQYYLSYVDPTGWACGTKLPHNVTSLLGVMDGAQSDLRPGLPTQSVEIHEPMRILFVIETTPEAMFGIMERNETIRRILRNGWAQLATLAPDSNRIQVFRGGSFHDYHPEKESLPQAPSSRDWYRGWRDHLEFAQIGRSGAS